jgi:hypothetical protein
MKIGGRPQTRLVSIGVLHLHSLGLSGEPSASEVIPKQAKAGSRARIRCHDAARTRHVDRTEE